jgi:hypothetical protein
VPTPLELAAFNNGRTQWDLPSQFHLNHGLYFLDLTMKMRLLTKPAFEASLVISSMTIINKQYRGKSASCAIVCAERAQFSVA